MQKLSGACVLSIAFAIALAAQPGDQTAPAWIGLYTNELGAWLENENRLETLCGAPDVERITEYDRCRSEKMAAKVRGFRLHAGPSRMAPVLGTLLVTATPGRGLHAYFMGAEGGAAAHFTPDLFDADWGYGPHFHQTIVARRGDWVRLPAAPFPSETWLNVRDLGPEPAIREVREGDILTSPRGDLFVLGVDADALRARLEQEADMECGRDVPPLVPAPELRIPWSDLYDRQGHLLVNVKYTRGC